MRTTGLVKEFALRFRGRLQEGAQPTRRALVLYAEQILDPKDQTNVPKWMRKTWLNYVTRQINRLVRLVEESSWVEGGYLADLLEVLNRNGYRRLVLACWGRMRLKGFEANTDAWAQAGSAMINLKRKRAARKLFGDWRTRTGIGMWMLGNYLLSLSRLTRDDLREVITTCDEGLTGLPHDHCARYLTYMQAEACALASDKSGLTSVWNQRAHYFEGDIKTEEFFPQSQRYLIQDIPIAVQLVQQSDDRGYGRLRRHLLFQRIWNPEVRARSRKIITLLLQAILVLWFIGRSLESLFR
jgi:hypothetical protein